MFYKCIAKDDVWLGKYTRDDFWSDCTLIPDELFYEDEYDDLISVVPRASKFFKPVDIDEDDTYEMFGARFANESIKSKRRPKRKIKERYSDDIRYVFKDVKSVRDSDGFMTEYTMYYDSDLGRYVFVFGDTDLYDPNDGYEEFDYECDSEREAREWFDDYNGFDDDDDDFYESKYRPLKNKVNESRYSGRYYVADENEIPFSEQPSDGYSALKAVERAQREAERASKMFNEPISETRTWFTILDKNLNRCYELEKGI